VSRPGPFPWPRRRSPAIVLALALVAAACNRPAAAPPVSVLQTGVAATLTAAPPLPATRTPPPSATPSLTLTPVPTWTATIGPTVTPTAPPLPTDDPRFGLGLDLSAPDYRDGFDRLTWGELSDPGAVNTLTDGGLKASDLLADAYIWWSATLPDAAAGDFYAEVTAVIQACRGKDAAGFAVRIGGVNLNSGYALEVSCDGHYRVRKFHEGAVAVLRDWMAAEAIVQGPQATNRLGLLANGDRITVFANGMALGPPLQDADLFYGTFGLYAFARETPGVVVTFDDFSVWHLSP